MITDEELYYKSPVAFRNRSSLDLVDPTKTSYEDFHLQIQQKGGSATFEVTDTNKHKSGLSNPLLPFKQQLEPDQ